LDKNVLQIVGNLARPNVISIGYSKHQRFIVVVLNGVGFDFDPSDVGSIRIFTGRGADKVTVVEGRGEFDRDIRCELGAGNDTFSGGHENDVVFGDDGNDVISLGDGDDAAVGGNGNDRIIGGDASKTIYGGAGDDVIAVGDGHGYIFGQDGNDAILTNGENYEILGDAGNDTLTGHGNDTLWGGGGGFTDILHGGRERNSGEVSGVAKIQKQLMPTEAVVPTSA
jgi:Ca2+-binding RTX toxin-like protein